MPLIALTANSAAPFACWSQGENSLNTDSPSNCFATSRLSATIAGSPSDTKTTRRRPRSKRKDWT
eukprot:12896383-Prorocentrum_lima.AAC.1